MKLSLISEVLDRPNMDGVEVANSINTNSITYKFADELDEYMVRIIPTKHSTEMMVDALIQQMPEEYKKQFQTDIKAFSTGVYIALESGGNNFETTGHRNHWFVYGKLIAIIMDYVKKRKPIYLQFSGATTDMDLVYDKFIKMSKKLDPTNSYSFYKGDIYVRDDIQEMEKRIMGSDNTRSSAITNRQEHLRQARKDKHKERNRTE